MLNNELLIRVEGDMELLKYLPEGWEEYFGRTNNSLLCGKKLCLELAPELKNQRFSAGWSLNNLDGNVQIVYAPHNAALFSLAYQSQENIKIRIKMPIESFVRLGTLCGMLLALHHVCVGFHGVTLQCEGQTIILSAPSGTGKTTLGKLLEEYAGARIINGDFALLSLDEKGVIFEPTPFCGSSKICLNERVLIDRIVFLAQNKNNIWRSLTERQGMVQFLSNAFLQEYDPALKRDVIDLVTQMMISIKMNTYAFAPTREAAEYFVRMIRS